MEEAPMNYISVSRTIHGMILQMIFQFRYTIIRKITEKEVLYSRDFWRFSEVLLLILSAGVHSGRSGNFQIKLKRCRHRIWQIQG